MTLLIKETTPKSRSQGHSNAIANQHHDKMNKKKTKQYENSPLSEYNNQNESPSTSSNPQHQEADSARKPRNGEMPLL